MNAISPSEKLARRIIDCCALAACVLALLVVFHRVLNQWWPGLVFLRNNFKAGLHTASFLELLSVAVLVQNRWPQQRGGRVFATLVAGTIGALSLVAISRIWLSGTIEFEVWITQLMTPTPAPSIGHLSTYTATTFLCTAAALGCLTITRSDSRWLRRCAFVLAALTLCAGLLTLLGHATGTPFFYGRKTTSMRCLTGIIFVLLALSQMMAAFPNNWWLQALTSKTGDLADAQSLRFRRALLMILVFLTGAIGITGFYFLRKEQTSLRTRVEQELATIADVKAAQIAAWRAARLNEANLIFHTPYAARRALDALAEPSSQRTREMFTGWLDPFLAIGPYAEALVLDAELKVGLVHPARAVGALPEAEQIQAKAAFRTRALTVADLHRPTNDTNGVRLSIMLPIVVRREGDRDNVPAAGLPRLPGDRSAALLVLRVDARQTLFPIVKTWPTSSRSAEVLLVRRDGRDGLFLSELRNLTNAALRLRFSTKLTDSPAALAALRQERVMRGLDHRGTPVVAVTRNIPNSPWSLVAKVDEEEIYAPVRERGLVLGITLSVLMVAVTLGLSLLWRQRDNDFLRRQVVNEHARLVLAERLAHLMDQANDIIAVTDDQWRILEMNDRGLKQYGYTLTELQKLRASDLRAPAARSDFPAFEEKFRTQGMVVAETLHQRKDGSTFPVEISIRTVEIDGAGHTLAIIRDITERKQAQDALRESEARYRTLVETAEDTILTITLDGRFTLLSPAFEINMGWTREAWLGRNFAELLHPDDLPRAQAMLAQIANGERPPLFDARVQRRSGDYLTVEVLGTPQWQDGKVVGVLAIARDVTVLRRMQETLASQEARLRMALQNAAMVTWEWDVRSGTIRYSDNVTAVAQGEETAPYCSVDGLLQEVHPEDRERLAQAINRTVTENAAYECEYRVRRLDGNYHWILGKGKAAVTENGKPVRLLGVSMDITGRKQAEAALSASESKYRNLVETTGTGYLILDLQGRVLDANREYVRLSGHGELHDILGRSVLEWTADKAKQQNAEAVAQCAKTGFIRNFETEYVDGSGRIKSLDVNATVEGEGASARIVSLCRDITERKQLEQVARERDERFRAIFDNSGEGIVMAEPETRRLIDANRAFLEMLGYSQDEIGTLRADSLHPAEALPEVLEQFQKLAKEEIQRTTDIPMKRKDGTIFLAKIHGFRLMVQGKRMLAGVFRDITEQKQAEEEIRQLNASLEQRVRERTAELEAANAALRQGEEQFRTLFANAPIGIGVADAAGNLLAYNDAMLAPGGYSRADIQKIGNVGGLYYVPKQRDEALARFRQQGFLKNRPVQFKRKDGSAYDALLFLTRTIFNGQPCVLAMVEDVTERMQAEAAVKASEARYRVLSEWTFEGIVIHENGRIVDCNLSFAHLFGREPSELIGHDGMHNFAPESREMVRQHIQSGRTGPYEATGLRKDGSTFPMEIQARLFVQGGRKLRFAACRDITERKRAEAALSEAHNRLEATLSALPDLLFEMDETGRIQGYRAPSPDKLYAAPETFLGRRMAEVLPPESAAVIMEAIREAVANGSSFGHVYQLPMPDGPQWFEVSVAAKDQAHEPGKRVVALARNITERKQAEEEIRQLNASLEQRVRERTAQLAATNEDLRASELRLKQAAHAGNVGLWDWNLTTNRVFYSPEWKQLIGYEDHEISDDFNEWQARVHPDDLEGTQQSIRAFLKRPSAKYEIEFRFRHKNGSYRWILAQASLLTGPDGQPQHMLGSHVDITERKRAEQAIATYAQLGQKLSSAKTAGEAAEIIMAAADNLFAWDACSFVFYSTSADQISHILNRDMIDGRRVEVSHPDTGQRPTHYQRRAIEHGAQLILREPTAAISDESVPFGDITRSSASLMFVPVRDAGNVTGVLSFQSYTAKAYSPADLEMLQSLADHVGGALTRIQIQEARQEGEALLRAFYDSPGALRGIVELLEDDILVISANASQAAAYGRTSEEMRNVRASELGVARDVINLWRHKLQECGKRNTTVTFEYSSDFRSPGTWGMTVASPLGAGPEGRARFAYLVHDITDRKSAEQEIQSLARFPAENPNPVIRISPEGRVLYVNTAAKPLMHGLINKRGHVAEDLWKILSPAFSRPQRIDFEREINRRVFSFIAVSALEQSDVNIYGRDITDLKRLQEQLLEVSDREQARIGQDLHDGLSQLLVTAAFDLNRLEKRIARTPDVAALAHQAGDTIDAAITEARGLARGLFAVQLGGEGLPHALHDLAATISARHQISCKVHCPKSVPIADNIAATHLFRIAQEAVNNAIKHAKSSHIEIRINVKAGQIDLTVTDDGIGFAGAPGSRSGMGLHIMDYRARALNGAFKIERATPKGTRVSCSIPRNQT